MLAANDPRHGTANGYRNLGCRCRPCTNANATYIRERNHRLGRNRPYEEYLAAVVKHGWSRYKQGGCRCDVCLAAAAAQKRRQRSNNRESYNAYQREYKRRKRAA